MARNQLIQVRRDTTANWGNVNPTPAEGEHCYDINTGYFRIGTGVTPYSQLPVFTPGATIADVVGVEWDTASSSPTLKRIDINGNELSGLTPEYFNNHRLWRSLGRCTIDPATNIPIYGTNARGDGLDLTGSSGNVMVGIPSFYAKFALVGTYIRFWVSPVPQPGFELFPCFVQRGGTEAALFIGAYESSGFLDGGTFKTQSASGKQPVTGAVAYTNLPNTGRLTIADAETYSNNIGAGYGEVNIWAIAAARLLYLIEYATWDSQTAIGKGIVDLPIGTDFAGKLTGADSANTNISTNGTGTGTGVNGQTPVVYRGIENLWGNTHTWVIGVNFYDTVHRIIKADGTGTMAAVLAAGSYDESASAPPNTTTAANGYISSIFTDTPLKYLMLGAATAGSSSTYLCDQYYIRAASATPTCLLFGGYWFNGLAAGVGGLSSFYGAARSSRNYGARLEFLKR